MIDIGYIVAELARTDPRGKNGIKTGIDIDMQGAVPQPVKQIVSDCLTRRVWEPIEGVRVSSAKPICPVYQGLTRQGMAHFKFPADLSLNVSNILVLRHMSVTMTDFWLAADLSKAKLTLKLWPDITIKL